MNLLDVIISPFSPGKSATIIFIIGLVFIALICGGTAALLVLHFRKEQKRGEKKMKSEE